MAITADGWFDWCERVPGPPHKTNGGWNPAAGIVGHSAEGGEAYLRGYNENWSDPRSASWIASNLYSGHLLQHYPITAQCWTSGCAYGNNKLLGIEHEGFAGELLTYGQQQTLARIIREVSELRGWVPIRQDTLWEHNEMAAYGAAPTACPSNRIPWYDVLALMYPLEPQPQPVQTPEEENMAAPYGSAWIEGNIYVSVIRGGNNELYAKTWNNGWSDWTVLPGLNGGPVDGDPVVKATPGRGLEVLAPLPESGGYRPLGRWTYAGTDWGFENMGGGVGAPLDAGPQGRRGR